jgi:xylulokinase
MYLLGIDIGSSAVKASLVAVETGQQAAASQSPSLEMPMMAERAGWAEQEPAEWWRHVCLAVRQVLSVGGISADSVQAVGLSYQMHGLVMVDRQQRCLRPSIIWCDSRAVETGEKAFRALGEARCMERLLNSPGNFTAAKLKWVQENEPALFDRIDKMMLPGDYIAMRLTGEISTTASGLSEAILWDFHSEAPADWVLEQLGIPRQVLPPVVGTFSRQGELTAKAAAETGLQAGTPVSYRAGDQPNNAWSLGVMAPGEVAATGGTSGVVYGVTDKPLYDSLSRINGFAHINHRPEKPRIGLLLCINGAGIQYSWLRRQLLGSEVPYDTMEQLAATVGVGAAGLVVLPFGNGAERMLGNRTPGGGIRNLHFNVHGKAHLVRAALEGIAFAFVYGVEILRETGMDVRMLRVGNDNLFRSCIFSETVATLLQCSIQQVRTNGAAGAAKGAGVALGLFSENPGHPTDLVRTYVPQSEAVSYQEAYARWEEALLTS